MQSMHARWSIACLLLVASCRGGTARDPISLQPDSCLRYRPRDACALSFRDAANACQEGKLKACTQAGWQLANGDGVTANPAGAQRLLQRACHGGDTEGCRALGHLMLRAKPAESKQLFCDACNRGDAHACFDCASLSAIGERKQYEDRLQDACDDGCALGCAVLGNEHAHQGHREKAQAFWRKASERGGVEGNYQLGRDYLAAGQVVSAETALRAGCVQAEAPTQDNATHPSVARQVGYAACNELGELLLKRGQGTEAAGLFHSACTAISGAACANLGAMLLTGSSVPKDTASAKIHLERACEHDIAKGCTYLGLGYLQGDFASQPDRFKGLQLLRKGCARPALDGTPCLILGKILAEGQIVPQNVPEAIASLRKACDLRVVEACELLARLGAPPSK